MKRRDSRRNRRRRGGVEEEPLPQQGAPLPQQEVFQNPFENGYEHMNEMPPPPPPAQIPQLTRSPAAVQPPSLVGGRRRKSRKDRKDRKARKDRKSRKARKTRSRK